MNVPNDVFKLAAHIALNVRRLNQLVTQLSQDYSELEARLDEIEEDALAASQSVIEQHGTRG